MTGKRYNAAMKSDGYSFDAVPVAECTPCHGFRFMQSGNPMQDYNREVSWRSVDSAMSAFYIILQLHARLQSGCCGVVWTLPRARVNVILQLHVRL